MFIEFEDSDDQNNWKKIYGNRKNSKNNKLSLTNMKKINQHKNDSPKVINL